MNITPSSTGKELVELGMAIHKLVNNLPLTMRCQNSKGIRIEDGKVVDYEYTGPVLERALQKGKTYRCTPVTGEYAGTPVVVVPIKEGGEVICALGVVDVTQGLFSDMIEISRRPKEIQKDSTRGEFY